MASPSRRPSAGTDSGRHVAFLRAVNVGGRSPASMAEVRAALAEAGFGVVESIGHAGTLLLDGGRRRSGDVARAVERALAARLGLETTAVVRTLAQVRAIVARAPFGPAPAASDEKRYLAFLSRPPRTRPRLPIEAPHEGLTILALAGDDVLVLSRAVGQGRSGFPNALVERAFGVPATSRNWNTVVKIAREEPRAVPSAGATARPRARQGSRGSSARR
jgi:uncharacterized protein (DUF1697 family)